MSNNLFSELFNANGLNVQSDEHQSENLTEFRPNYRKGQNNRYEAIIRFVPNPVNPASESIISKWIVYLKNPLTNQGQYVDSPTSIGEKDPMSDMFFSLRGSQNKQVQALADDFKRHQKFYSLVQVIKCVHEPKLEGKILIWSYGIKMMEKIRTEMAAPQMPGMPIHQPFDLFNGRLLKVIAVSSQQNFNNLDQSIFCDISYPNNCLVMPVPDPNDPSKTVSTHITREIAATPEGQKMIQEFLTKNSPDISKNRFQPWDANTKKYVDDMIVLHSRLLRGEPVSAPQKAAVMTELSGTQTMGANPTVAPATPSPAVPVTPAPFSMGAAVPNAGQPVATPTISGISGLDLPDMGNAPTPSAAPAAVPGSLDGILNDAIL